MYQLPLRVLEHQFGEGILTRDDLSSWARDVDPGIPV